MNPLTQRIKNSVVSKLTNKYLEDEYRDDLNQDCYLESIKIIQSFFKEKPSLSVDEEWLRYYYKALFTNMQHHYLLKYRGNTYNRKRPLGKRYENLMPKFYPIDSITLIMPQDSSLLLKETKQEVLDYVGFVKPRYAEVLALKIQELSESEIADVLGITKDMVKNDTKRGRALARQWREQLIQNNIAILDTFPSENNFIFNIRENNKE